MMSNINREIGEIPNAFKKLIINKKKSQLEYVNKSEQLKLQNQLTKKHFYANVPDKFNLTTNSFYLP